MRLILVGDVMLGRWVNESLAACPPEYPWGDTLSVLRSADALIINLECVISDRGRPWSGKTFTFRTDARNVAVLEAARVTAVSLANNHSLDYGDEALVECLEILSTHGIGAAGAGRSLDDAMKPARLSAEGGAITLLAFTDNEPGWEAGPAAPGVFYVPLIRDDSRLSRWLSAIAHAAETDDLVVVSAHWGPNWGYHPLPEHVEAAHRFIDAGADVVFGHSPHVVRAVERYREKPILYSGGDFIDDYAVDEHERNDQSFVFSLDYEGGRLRRVLMIPTVIERLQARLAVQAERPAILSKMKALCRSVGTETRETPDGMEILLS